MLPWNPPETGCLEGYFSFGKAYFQRLYMGFRERIQTQLDTLTYLYSDQAGADVKENLKNWAKAQEAELAEETGDDESNDLVIQTLIDPHPATVMIRTITFSVGNPYTPLYLCGCCWVRSRSNVDPIFSRNLNVWIGIRLGW